MKLCVAGEDLNHGLIVKYVVRVKIVVIGGVCGSGLLHGLEEDWPAVFVLGFNFVQSSLLEIIGPFGVRWVGVVKVHSGSGLFPWPDIRGVVHILLGVDVGVMSFRNVNLNVIFFVCGWWLLIWVW